MNALKKIIPKTIYTSLQPIYHLLLASLSAVLYNFPSKKLYVIGITGTKGKSTTVELINSILEASGKKTALTNTIRFKINDHSYPNRYKMSMPGRFFMQKFLADAEKAGCTHAIIEITSEGARQYRNKYIDLDAFVFTNLAPEHIESHGSYEKYRDVKLGIGKTIETSQKKNKIIVINKDDKEAPLFLNIRADKTVTYSLKNAEPYSTTAENNVLVFKDEKIVSHLGGEFNLYNILAAATLADAMGISPENIRKGIENVQIVKGRFERVDEGQNFDVIVDYAHTPDSLEAVYKALKDNTLVCVLGNTGGGRDIWKRPDMARIADAHCSHIILANEDPYDEDPQTIVNEMRKAITNTPSEIILDRRTAIKTAIEKAVEISRKNEKRVSVVITGKGTDPYIMGPGGSKQEWSDEKVAREEVRKVL